MGKTWVLDTETKGTGAQMVPLEKVQRRASREPELNVVHLKRPAPAPPPAPEQRRPRRFRVVDLMSGQTLSEGAEMRGTLHALERVRSSVDVMVYVWQPRSRRWRPLTLAEQRTLWESRHGADDAPR